MLRSTAAAAAPLGLGVDNVDFDSLEDDLDQMKKKNDGKNFNLVLQGSAHPTLVTVNDAEGTGDDVARAFVSDHYGKTSGWFSGGYRGQSVGLELGVLEPPVSINGILQLTRPDEAIAAASSYQIAFEGVADVCCGHNNHNFEGKFQSIGATGQFAGTSIKGEIASKSQMGWPIKVSLKGIQIDE